MIAADVDRLGDLQRVTTLLLAARGVSEVAHVAIGEAAHVLGARFANVNLLDDEAGLFEVVAWAGAAPDLIAGWSRFPNDPNLPAGAAVRGRVPILLRNLIERDARFPALATVAVRDRAYAILPLLAGDKALGCVVFGWETERDFASDEVAFLQILAAQCAEALNRAIAFDRERHIAETLQRSLLPSWLPDIPAVTVAVRHHPAGSGEEVGGDFYDVFALGGGRYGITIGDVSGKGVHAAAATALVRHTIRALARQGLPPADVLQGANTALLAAATPTTEGNSAALATHAATSVQQLQPDVDAAPKANRISAQMCTAALLILEPANPDRTVTVTCALAGHPHPLLRDPGSDSLVPVGISGTLLGLLTVAQLTDSQFILKGSEQLLLYTDGYLDIPTKNGRVNPLIDLFAASTGAVELIAQALQTSVLDQQDGHAHDDMALIVLTTRESG